jgi:hypothetical protein
MYGVRIGVFFYRSYLRLGTRTAVLTDEGESHSMNEDNDDMPSKVHDIIAEVASGLASPRVIPAIDKAAGEFQQALASLAELRKAAVRLHGDLGQAKPASSAASGSQKDAKGERAPIETIANLVDKYRTDRRSPYFGLRHKTRQTYDSVIGRILRDYGPKKLADLNKQSLQDFFDGWAEGGKLPMARSLITMMRGLVNFGWDAYDDSGCERLALILHNMDFPMPEKRQAEPVTAKHVKDIVSKANEMGWHSIGLAQALQFELGLRQKQVIGEWVPLSEPGTSDVHNGETKWLYGLRWADLNKIDLGRAPTVAQELKKLANMPDGRPVVVNEYSDLPYTAHEFRRKWRLVARAAGVPDHVYNMDSRGSEAAQGERESAR